MMAYELENITIVNIKCVNCRCIIWNMSGGDVINRLNKSKLDDKGSL